MTAAGEGKHEPGPAGLPCPKCETLVALKHESFVAYFRSGGTPCPTCGERLDWWKEAQNGFARIFPEWQVAALVGAQVSTTQIALKPEQSAFIELSELAIPQGAEILNVYLETTVQGDPPHTLPALMVETQLRFDPFPSTLILYGAAHGAAAHPSTQDVCIVWVAPGVNEVSVHNLVDAARQYNAGRYHALVVPANVAVESALTQATNLAVLGFTQSKRVTKAFLDDAATYSHQLNVLAPMLCFATGVPPLHEPIRGLLNRLRGLRNEVAHNGRPESPLSQRDAAKLLVAAVFGFNFAQLLYAEVGMAQQEKRLPAPALNGGR